jgi:adenine-specific DNA methylase
VVDPVNLTPTAIHDALVGLRPQTWPPRHRVHKYWGRKPANVVTAYIDQFSRAGDSVLDPFAGSGVTVVEADRLGRRGIGFDANPLAARLGRALLAPPPRAAFEAASQAVVEALHPEVLEWFSTRCASCGEPTPVRSIAHDGDDLTELRYRCDRCGHAGTDLPGDRDRALSEARVDVPPSTPDDDIYYGWQMRKLRRAGLTRWSELFTPRSLRLAGLLRARILEVSDPRVREWLLITLTAALAQCTRMIADSSGAGGGPSWKINCYWLPSRWQELNPLVYFGNRVRKSLAAIDDLGARGPHVEPHSSYERCDSRQLPLADASVDYIFTDPPYGGEGVQYGELSMLWCLWLDEPHHLHEEIAFNPVRELSQEDYAGGLAAVFEQCHRVLRPDRWMTVTFANKDPVVFQSLLDACAGAGFHHEITLSMGRSAPAVTETTAPRAPTRDEFLIFRA